MTSTTSKLGADMLTDEQIIEYGRSFPALLELLTREPARVAFVQCQRALLARQPAAIDKQDERVAKECPFCGGAAEVHERNTDDGKPFYVQCDGCYIEVAFAATREASLAIWNARAASTSANLAPPIHTIGGVPVDHSDDVSITREEYENLLRMVTNVAQGASGDTK